MTYSYKLLRAEEPLLRTIRGPILVIFRIKNSGHFIRSWCKLPAFNLPAEPKLHKIRTLSGNHLQFWVLIVRFHPGSRTDETAGKGVLEPTILIRITCNSGGIGILHAQPENIPPKFLCIASTC